MLEKFLQKLVSGFLLLVTTVLLRHSFNYDNVKKEEIDVNLQFAN